MCEVCLMLSPTTPSSTSLCCSFPSMAQEGDLLKPYLRDCCLNQESASVSIQNTTSLTLNCGNFLNNYGPYSQYSACCRKMEPQLNESQAKVEVDIERVPLMPPPSSVPQQRGEDGITGLQCRTNRTLRFYVLDVALNWALAMRLGATDNTSASIHQEAGSEGNGSGDRSFATIVNLKDEVHYVLHRSPTATLTESLETFIRNFSAPYSLLQRHLVGVEVRKGREAETRHQDKHQHSPSHLVTEVTTTSFLPTVMDVRKDVLLFYYTQWCGFCSVLNHILLQLARLLQANNTITVARVNVARNDLPWEFMVDHVPSILLFPKYRKHFSVKFPDHLPITLPSLLHFILQHTSSVQYADKPVAASGEAEGLGASAILRADFVALQREVQALHQARERLSQQLAQLWRDNRHLKFDTRRLESQNIELRQERQNLEEQHREKSRKLGEAVRRLQELADTSENLLNENTLLRVLLRALKDRMEAKEQVELERNEAERKRSHMVS